MTDEDIYLASLKELSLPAGKLEINVVSEGIVSALPKILRDKTIVATVSFLMLNVRLIAVYFDDRTVFWFIRTPYHLIDDKQALQGIRKFCRENDIPIEQGWFWNKGHEFAYCRIKTEKTRWLDVRKTLKVVCEKRKEIFEVEKQWLEIRKMRKQNFKQ